MERDDLGLHAACERCDDGEFLRGWREDTDRDEDGGHRPFFDRGDGRKHLRLRLSGRGEEPFEKVRTDDLEYHDSAENDTCDLRPEFGVLTGELAAELGEAEVRGLFGRRRVKEKP